jgi:hypothetical protein
MILKEAALKALEDLKQPSNHWAVLKCIQERQYFDFKDARTPESTISAQLGDLVRAGDSRINRIKQANGAYLYFLTHWEDVSFENQSKSIGAIADPKVEKSQTYLERDLHPLLCSFLQSIGVLSKTIYHEKSGSSDDNTKKWVHPDVVGAQFFKTHSQSTLNIIRATNREAVLKLSSYEIKKEIYTDYELKKAFFQAVSNSSWANLAYLVVFEIGENLLDEMERLHLAFGVGLIILDANPYLSKVKFVAQHRALDFRTMEKLCHLNKDFDQFMAHTGKIINAEIAYLTALQKELMEFCDKPFSNEAERLTYCLEKNIPFTAEQ